MQNRCNNQAASLTNYTTFPLACCKVLGNAQAKQELEDAAAAIRAATQLTVGNKPSRQSWLTGPFAHWAEALEAVALQRAEPTHTELAAKVLSTFARHLDMEGSDATGC